MMLAAAKSVDRGLTSEYPEHDFRGPTFHDVDQPLSTEHGSKKRIAPVPRALSFLRPTSVEEAVAMLNEHGDEAKVVAGSTALTIMLRNRLIDPSVLVSIGRLPGLNEITSDAGQLRLGALATHRDVERSPIAKERIPVLTDTFHKVANVRVRNVATVGGVVAEADYASDPPAVFLALDAEIEAQGPDGKRTIPASEFFLSFYTTALAQNEIVTAVRVPVPQPGTRAVYEKFVTRLSVDRPCVAERRQCAYRLIRALQKTFEWPSVLRWIPLYSIGPAVIIGSDAATD